MSFFYLFILMPVLLNVNNVVQVTPAEKSVVDVKFQGCVGFVKTTNEQKTVVSFYTPMKDGEPAYVDDKEFDTTDLSLVGVPVLNPN